MDKPKYYDEMSKYFPEDIESRVVEIEKEMKDIKNLKNSNKLSTEDIEDVSDNYQYHLEWNETLKELNDELQCLMYQQYLDMKNESELNSLENQSSEQ